jgi:hypothetical protein
MMLIAINIKSMTNINKMKMTPWVMLN